MSIYPASRPVECGGEATPDTRIDQTGLAAQAMHIAIGMMDAQNQLARATGNPNPWALLDKTKDSYSIGWDSAVLDYLAPLAPLVAARCEAEYATRLDEGFPSVWEYEVSEPLGAWFFHTAINNRAFPTIDAAARELDQLVSDFFNTPPPPERDTCD